MALITPADVQGAAVLATARICAWLCPDATSSDALELKALILSSFHDWAKAHEGEARLELLASAVADAEVIVRCVRANMASVH